MFHSDVPLKILFLLASSHGVSSLLPPPLVYVEMFPNNLTEGESVKISCVAPRAYTGAYFYLFMVGQSQPVQTSPAAQTRHQFTFLLENVTTASMGLYQCQYSLLNGSLLQPSALSDTVEIIVEAFSSSTSPPTGPPGSDCTDPSWILVPALSVTSALLLVMMLVVAMMVIGRCMCERQQLEWELDSYWTQAKSFTSELSFDNCMFTVSPKINQEAAGSHNAQISSTWAARLGPSSSPDQPDFFTFRATE